MRWESKNGEQNNDLCSTPTMLLGDINGLKNTNILPVMISLSYYIQTRRLLTKIMIAIQNSFFNVKIRMRNICRRIFKAKRRAKDYRKWSGGALLAISLALLFLLMKLLPSMSTFSSLNKIFFHLSTYSMKPAFIT